MKIHALKEYIHGCFGFDISATRLKPTLPFYLQRGYEFYRLDLQLPFLAPTTLVTAWTPTGEYPGMVALKKQIPMIAAIVKAPVVFVTERLTAMERRTLIENRLSFIVPGRQFYVPELAMDLREGLATMRKAPNEEMPFSPAAQAIFIQWLRNCAAAPANMPPESNIATKNGLLGLYSYSRVTWTKAVKELIEAGVIQENPSRPYTVKTYALTGTIADVFRKALPRLRSPVKKTILLESPPTIGREVRYAGISALARLTMLAEGNLPVYAMTQATYLQLKKNGRLREATSPTQAMAKLEIWRYQSPEIAGVTVDDISLYLALKDDPDERVQLALQELEERQPWLKLQD